MKRVGFIGHVVIDESGMIVCGHLRWEVARDLGMTEIPCIVLSDMSPADMKAYSIAENRIAELAGWDAGLLATELKALIELDVSYDLTLTGFDTAEIDMTILDRDGSSQHSNDADDTVAMPEKGANAVSRLGDLWRLEDHLLSCGDAREGHVLAYLMDGKTARMVITDPPYNVAIDGHVSGKGRVRHAEFAMASGEMSRDAYQWFLGTALGHAASHCAPGALLYIFIDWRHLAELIAAARGTGLTLLNLVVWSKSNAGMGSLYRSQHELLPVFKVGKAPHVNNVELGRYGRNRTNVWTYPGANTFRNGRMEDLEAHPTVKPVALLADAMRDASDRGDIVLDPFVGSGSTILAAERTGRRAYAIEIDPIYVDVAIRRWQAASGKQAVHETTGLTFDRLAAERKNDAAPERPDEHSSRPRGGSSRTDATRKSTKSACTPGLPVRPVRARRNRP